MAQERYIDRLDEYMKLKGFTDYRVTQECDLSIGLIGKARKGDSDLGKKAIEKILSKYTDLNRVWLFTGEGEMLNNATITNSNNQGSNINNGTMTDSTQSIGVDSAVFEKQAEAINKLIDENVRMGARIDKLIDLLSNK